ncbi:MAG: metallophosphoesterase family protein [Thermodesulfobacteriota bacterium]
MKMLYATDLHGKTGLYQQLLELSIASSSELVALGGDLLPSFPPTRRYEDMIPNQRLFVNQFLFPFFRKILKTTPVKQIFLIPGNWDLGYPFLFAETIEGLTDLSQKNYRLENGYEFIGYPFVPPTPFRPKDYEKMDDPEAPWSPQKNPSYIRASGSGDQLVPIDPQVYLRERGTIHQDLNLLPKPIDQKSTIYIMHSPPFGTKLDFIQGGKSAGSRSIRVFIEENQPRITLHGHIHESPEVSGAYLDHIGETLCVNPGQSAWSGRDSIRLHAVTLEVENVQETIRHTCYQRVRSN